jgi:3-phosphoshikimate 1-carboxyvinyltransferase
VTEQIEIPVADGPLHARVRPPGSKSITNRALVCAALADGQSELRAALDCEDTRVMIAALSQLGLEVDCDLARATISVRGGGGQLPTRQADLFVANSGTTIRFLTAMLSTIEGEFRLDGIERMRQRPIADLLAALRQLGVNAASENDDGCPPVRLSSTGMRGGAVEIRGDVSSQFLSGLLMASPNARSDVAIELTGELVSKPYVEMTLGVMNAFGVRAEHRDLQRFEIERQEYRPAKYAIEPDASAASYFWAAAAVTGGSIAVQGLTRDALQGDVAFCECLAAMGCDVEYQSEAIKVTAASPLRGVDVDMNAISDTVQTLAVVALFAEGPTRISNVEHIRHKETDRIGDLARELRRLGAEVDERQDGLTITPAAHSGAAIETYNDHRMAMSFAVAGLRIPHVTILNPRCIEKTYPRFFDDFLGLYADR